MTATAPEPDQGRASPEHRGAGQTELDEDLPDVLLQGTLVQAPRGLLGHRGPGRGVRGAARLTEAEAVTY